MPYNKEKQLLFIHIPKCGGTSIEKSLGSFSEIGVGIKNGKAIQHYTLKDYQNNLLFTNNFIKFSIVRNPYNRAISDFKWFKNYSKLNFKTLDEYLDYAENYIKNNYKPNTIWDDHFMPQYEYLLTSKNKIITENIFRFEDRKSINNFLNKYNLKILHLNKTKNDKISFTTEQKNRIYKLYQKDFEYFGYEK